MKRLTWDEKMALAWKRFLPPARPSLAELKIYEKYIKSLLKKDKEVLILGLTPEFRDLILKYQGSPVCLDTNPRIYQALTRLLKRKGKEKLIVGDWTEIPKLKIKKKYFLIIGHQSFNMIPLRRWEKFLKGLKTILDPQGKIITTVTVFLSQDKKIKTLDGFLRYRKLKQPRPPLFTEVMKYLVIGSYNFFKRHPSMKDLRQRIEYLFKKGLINKKEKEEIKKIIPPSDLVLYLPSRDWVDKKFKKYFHVEIKYHPQDSYSKNWPIYILSL